MGVLSRVSGCLEVPSSVAFLVVTGNPEGEHQTLDSVSPNIKTCRSTYHASTFNELDNFYRNSRIVTKK